MTATSDESRPRRSAPPRATVPVTEPVREVCPYLEAVNGGWRSVQPTRDHRCTATAPASPLALSKQRELCLQLAHFGCATYQAAREVAAESRAASGDGGLWPETRGAVLSLEPVRGGRAGIPGAAGRGSGQALLVALMVVAFLVLVIARVTPPVSGEPPSSFDVGVFGSAAPGASGGSIPASATPVATSTPLPSAPSAEPSTTEPSASAPASAAPASAGPSGGPSAAPSPSAAGTTYRVKGGDTLSGIAARFGTTVRALKAANALNDAGVIHPGQVLVIPH